MNDYANYFEWLADGGWIRASARAIIINKAGDQILIERNHGSQNEFANFIGGGLEVGESLQECIERELNEEALNAKIAEIQYLFVVENFMTYQSEVRHSLEHYFEVYLVDENLLPRNEGVEFLWVPVEMLGDLDLRPYIVRDMIWDGTCRDVKHVVFRDSN